MVRYRFSRPRGINLSGSQKSWRCDGSCKNFQSSSLRSRLYVGLYGALAIGGASVDENCAKQEDAVSSSARKTPLISDSYWAPGRWLSPSTEHASRSSTPHPTSGDRPCTYQWRIPSGVHWRSQPPTSRTVRWLDLARARP